LALARVLLGRPDVLLMDEPTNHLDIESIIWLEQFLRSFSGALLMTSHDREFMNRLVSKIAEIDAGLRSSRTRAITTFMSASAHIRETNQQAAVLPGSNPCWPRSNASLTASGHMPQGRPRCKAASRHWTQIEEDKSSCPGNDR